MRLAVAGKGGAGKTTFAATACRHLARDGWRVVAVDADSNPNLHTALGVSSAQVAVVPFLPVSLVSRRLDGPGLQEPVADVLAAHAAVGPDGVRLVRMGMPEHADEGCLCSAHATVSALLADLADEPGTVTILDLEASPEHLGRGTARHADVLVLVAEPYFRSLEAVRLQAGLAAETAIGRVVVVANKCRNDTDRAGVAAFCERHGLELAGDVPWADEVLDADVAATPLIDACPESPAVEAIATVTEGLLSSARPEGAAV